RACATGASCRGARARQARPVVRSRTLDVRRPDPVRPRRPVARCRDQARPRQGVSGNGRRRRRARDPAGSAARGRRPAEGGSEVAAREARIVLLPATGKATAFAVALSFLQQETTPTLAVSAAPE